MSDFLLGGQIRESVSLGTSRVVGAAKYNNGLIGERERGITNKPVLVNSLQDDRLKFGGVSNTKFGAYVSRDMILNAAPYSVNLYFVRVAGTGSLAAEGDFGIQLTNAFTVANPIFKVWAGQSGLKDVGTWANSSRTDSSKGVFIRCYPKGSPLGEVNQYVFYVYSNTELKETWSGSTWVELIAKVNISSNYVMLEPVNLALDITDTVEVYLTGGVYAAPVEADYIPVTSDTNPKGLAIFDGITINQFAITEYQTLSSAIVGANYASTHKNKPVFVYNLPLGSGDAAVANFSASLQTPLNSYSAGYNFWVKVNDEAAGLVWTPSVGVVLGLYVRVPAINDDSLVYPPAGSDNLFVGVKDVSPRDLSVQVYTRWVKRYYTNVVRATAGGGFYIGSSRTNSTNVLFQSIHIRRLMSYYGTSLLTYIDTKTQKPSTDSLKKDLFMGINSFFQNEYRTGSLETSISFSQSCIITITTDATDRKVVKINVAVILTECTESIVLTIERNDNSLNLSIN